jgi:hypothetical protein
MFRGNCKKTGFVTIALLGLSAGAPALASGIATAAQMASQYTTAAGMSGEAGASQSILSKVWTGVASVCVAGCASSAFGGPLGGAACEQTNKAADVTTAVTSASVGQALQAAVATQAGKAAETQAAQTATDAADKSDETKTACTAAAKAVIKALMQGRSADASEQSTQSNLEKARSLDQSGRRSPVVDVNAQVTQPGPGGAAGMGSGNLQLSESTAGAPGPCASARKSSNLRGMLECAFKADPTLPPAVLTPGFQKDFERASGRNFGDFMKEPKGAMSAAELATRTLGGAMSTPQIGRLANVIASLDQSLAGAGEAGNSAVYTASSAGSRSPASSDGEPDFNAILAGVMAQFNPQTGAPGSPQAKGVSAVAFAMRDRAPASIAEDRQLGLFDRVTYRYIVVSRKMFSGGNP